MTKVDFTISQKTAKFDSAEDVAKLVEEIKSIPELESITLGGNTFGVEACRAIAAELKSKQKLKTVNFSDMFTGRLKDEIPLALDAFVEALEDKEFLTTVDLSDNAFGPHGAKPLMRLIVNNRNIRVLKLNNNGLGIEGARLISVALIEAHEKNEQAGVEDNLQVIVAGRNRMETPGAEHLAKAFQMFQKSLKHIQMPQNSIRPNGIAKLLESVKDCKLEYLDLQDNTFTHVGSTALAEALPNWPNLKVLNIGDCLLGGKGGIAVISALTNKCPEIERIALFFNEINEEGAKLVPQMLQKKPNLDSIELNGNNFDGEGPVAQGIRDMLRSLGKENALDELDEMELDSEAEEYENDGDDGQEAEDDDEPVDDNGPSIQDLSDKMNKLSTK